MVLGSFKNIPGKNNAEQMLRFTINIAYSESIFPIKF